MDPERIDRLRSFGLSDSAARAYLALLELGFTEARDVSRLARIPLAKVYQTLDQLQERGLVSVHPTSPRRYEPVGFDAFLAKLRERHLLEARALETAAPDLVPLFRMTGAARLADRGGIRVVKGRAEALDAFRTALGKAERSVLHVPSANWQRRSVYTRPLLEAAEARGLHVRVLALLSDTAAATTLPDVRNLRIRPPQNASADSVEMAFFDDTKALLVHYVPDDASTTRGKDIGLVVDEQALAHAIQSPVEARWTQGVPHARVRYARDGDGDEDAARSTEVHLAQGSPTSDPEGSDTNKRPKRRR